MKLLLGILLILEGVIDLVYLTAFGVGALFALGVIYLYNWWKDHQEL